MRNTHTDALAPWDRPCWTDGPVPLHDQFGLTAHEARIGRWCFDGDGGDGSGDDTVDEAFNVSANAPAAQSAAESAAAAAAAAGVDDVNNPDAQQARDDFMEQMEKGDFGYNELEEMGYFDIKDASIAEADAQIANAIQTDAKGKGYDVNVGVDPDGTFSYTAGPDGTFGDVAAVAGSQIAQGLMDLSPTVQAARAIGLSTPDFSLSPRQGSDMAATAEYDPFATGYQDAYNRNMAMNNTAPLSAVSISSLPGDGLTPQLIDVTSKALAEKAAMENQLTSGVPNTLSELMENLNATPEYDPFSPGPINDRFQQAGVAIAVGSPEDTYQAAYDRNMASVNQDFDAMVEAENAIGGGGYYDEVFGNENMAMAPANEGGDNPVVAAIVPVAAPVAPEPPPTFLSSYQTPQFTPAPVATLGLLAPPQIYGSPTRQQMIQNYINQYPTLDQAFSRQLG